MKQYLIAGLAFIALAAVGFAWMQSGTIDRLSQENAALRASIVAYESERELAREAQAVAEARANAVEAKAKEYDLLREDVLRNGEDAELPFWLLNLVISLRPN